MQVSSFVEQRFKLLINLTLTCRNTQGAAVKTLKVYCDVLTITREVSGERGSVLAAIISRRLRLRRPTGRKCCQTAINTDEDRTRPKASSSGSTAKYHALFLETGLKWKVCECVTAHLNYNNNNQREETEQSPEHFQHKSDLSNTEVLWIVGPKCPNNLFII